ncbi:MAG: hypothetical protein JNK05_15290 [Myxococcales bacterium]|nr:hypothetical protein [Myxococcales bacterium]
MGAVSTAIKGAVWRSQVACLEQLRWKQRVRAELAAPTQALVDEPPSIVEWVSIEHPLALCSTIERLFGQDEVARFGAAATVGLLDSSLRPVLQGIFAVFGANPHSLFGRSELIVRAILRGGGASYTRVGEREGDVDYTVDWPEIPAAYWRMWRGSLTHGFTLCRCSGTIAPPSISDSGRAARFRLSWE